MRWLRNLCPTADDSASKLVQQEFFRSSGAMGRSTVLHPPQTLSSSTWKDIQYTQQTFFRWLDTYLVKKNRINESGPFTISSEPFKISVVHDESSYGCKSKWINLFYIGIDPVKTIRNNTASYVIASVRKEILIGPIFNVCWVSFIIYCI